MEPNLIEQTRAPFVLRMYSRPRTTKAIQRSDAPKVKQG